MLAGVQQHGEAVEPGDAPGGRHAAGLEGGLELDEPRTRELLTLEAG